MVNKRETGSTAITRQFLSRATEGAGYLTIVIGYLISIFSSTHLTLMNVFAFTATQLLYAIVFWQATSSSNTPRRTALWLVLLSLLTVLAGLTSLLDIYLDWLLYFATVAVYCMSLSLPRALLASGFLYLDVGLTLYLINGGIGFTQPWIFLLAGFAFVATFSLANKLLIAQQERSETLLHQLEVSNHEREQANEQLRQYANEVEELTIDRERTRMAREIHDTLGHYLTILSIQLETISKLQERDPARAMIEVAEARRVAAQSMQEIRNAVAALRPSSIATLSLPEALTQLAGEFSGVCNGVELILDLETQLPLLSPDQQLALYRAAQEALTNIRKHAHATKVLLRLRYEQEKLELVILDNGVGEEATIAEGSGFGLLGLRERIELLSGQVAYGREQPSGYRVTVRVPVAST